MWEPKEGMRTQLRYEKNKRAIFGYHGAVGIIEVVGRGPGPENVLVKLDDGKRVVTSRKHLFPENFRPNEVGCIDE